MPLFLVSVLSDLMLVRTSKSEKRERERERERDCSQFSQELTRTSNVDSDLAVDARAGI